MKHITILGGGIAGLTAAINLKKAGIAVTLHERKDYCGKHTNNFQMLENWTFSEDSLYLLRSMGIQTDFYTAPRFSQTVVSPSGEKYVGTSQMPAMYLVKRGRAFDSVDRSLERQSIAFGIDIVYNSTHRIQDADIVATGIKQSSYIATGITFSCGLEDNNLLIFDDNLSKKFYSYFIVHENIGEIACVNPVDIKNHQDRLKKTVDRFEKSLLFRVEKISDRFSAPVHFGPMNQPCINGRYHVGEAAGFQDCFMGFGMLYAFKSGYLAAKSIIENLDYQQLLNAEILKPIKISIKNRALFEKLSNPRYERLITVLNSRNPIIKSLLGGNDLSLILKKLYNNSLSFFLRSLLFW